MTKRWSEKEKKEKLKNPDLCLINSWHEGVQRDDNKPV